MTVTVTVPHSEFEKFQDLSRQGMFAYERLGYSDDGEYVRLFGSPAMVFDIIESGIHITMH